MTRLDQIKDILERWNIPQIVKTPKEKNTAFYFSNFLTLNLFFCTFVGLYTLLPYSYVKDFKV